jgi:hypothetical protein
MVSRRIKSAPVHSRAYRNRNQRTLIVEYEPQCSLGRDSDFAADLSQHFGAFSPLPFNASVDAQRIRGPHLINLADEKSMRELLCWTKSQRRGRFQDMDIPRYRPI